MVGGVEAPWLGSGDLALVSHTPQRMIGPCLHAMETYHKTSTPLSSFVLQTSDFYAIQENADSIDSKAKSCVLKQSQRIPYRSLRKRAGSWNKSTNTGTRRSSAYDGGFGQHVIGNDVFPHGYESANDESFIYPDNLDEINARAGPPKIEYKTKSTATYNASASVPRSSSTLTESKPMSSIMSQRPMVSNKWTSQHRRSHFR